MKVTLKAECDDKTIIVVQFEGGDLTNMLENYKNFLAGIGFFIGNREIELTDETVNINEDV